MNTCQRTKKKKHWEIKQDGIWAESHFLSIWSRTPDNNVSTSSLSERENCSLEILPGALSTHWLQTLDLLHIKLCNQLISFLPSSCSILWESETFNVRHNINTSAVKQRYHTGYRACVNLFTSNKEQFASYNMQTVTLFLMFWLCNIRHGK